MDRTATITMDYEEEEQFATVLYFLGPILVEHHEITVPFAGKRAEIIVQA